MAGRRVALALAGALGMAVISWSVAEAKPQPPAPPDSGGLSVYRGVVDKATLAAINELGVDRHELKVSAIDAASGQFEVEVILSGEQAADLTADGAELTQKSTRSRRPTAPPPVFRTYLGEGGIQAELAAQAESHPNIAQLRSLGTTVRGVSIDAVRVTSKPGETQPGKRPTTVFLAAQHAREWITPEMVRRLLDYVLDGYGTDDRITELVDDNELWFIPVANPDGYDFSHSTERLWRKNLRDNIVDGKITPGDGVDLNRNFTTRWGYDNEGSSPNFGSETYRGPSELSEPENQALDSLFAEITPEFFINYHSAAELLLYGLGWQVSTPSPDDVIYEAMAGNDVIGSAIEGYDPDISAELYTTNGDTDSHMQAAYGALGFTPEMSTCETASDRYPNDWWRAEDCESGFHFPDDERLIQEEFEKNIPFALAVAESAKDPDDPVSLVGVDTPDFVVDPFAVSHGDPQTVAVTAKRALGGVELHFRINGGDPQPVRAAIEWSGGERYGHENADYYAEYRGNVTGAQPGDEVEVWFSARTGSAESDHFTYTVADGGGPVLIVANEDYTGVNPTFPQPPGGPPKYVDEHVAALKANGITPIVWDVDVQGIPHDLGVLSHYETVLWYLGDNRLTQDREDFITETPAFAAPFHRLEDSSVAERAQYLTLAMRDYLNAGGTLIHAGETTAFKGLLDELLGGVLGGMYYGLDDHPDQQCVVRDDPFGDCLLLANDFVQYYLGAWDRAAGQGAREVVSESGGEALFGGPATTANPIDEPGVFTLTSELLPPEDFPDFHGSVAFDYVELVGTIGALDGDFSAVANHADESYMRLGRTFNLTGVMAEQNPTLHALMLWSTEPSYDNVIVEAHTVGQDNWMTLPTIGAGTTAAVPAECEAGFYLGLHPNLGKYLRINAAGTACEPTSLGAWNSLTGESGGAQPVSFDLSRYAGQQVEIIVSYVTDPISGGRGVMLDNAHVTAGSDVAISDFEADLAPWQVLGPPAGSGRNPRDWVRAGLLGNTAAGVATDDTVLLGFGLEQLEDPAARAELVGDILEMLNG